jgi:hypothetical protein
MSALHRLYRFCNAYGDIAVRTTNKLIGDGKEAKGILNNCKDSYQAGKRGITYEVCKAEPPSDKELQNRMIDIFKDA